MNAVGKQNVYLRILAKASLDGSRSHTKYIDAYARGVGRALWGWFFGVQKKTLLRICIPTVCSSVCVRVLGS